MADDRGGNVSGVIVKPVGDLDAAAICELLVIASGRDTSTGSLP
jgi:hypothetical protein